MKSPYAVEPRRVEKPWGWELVWAEAEAYVGKLLFVRAGQALSLQYHEVKDEAWLVQEGRATLELGEAIVEKTVARLVEVLREMATFEMPTPPTRGEDVR